MDDRISTLNDSLLCHILSFLSTKECVATSLLSKRWKPLWRFVSCLYFDDLTNRNFNQISCLRFVEWVYSVILSRDHNQPIKKFCFKSSCGRCDANNVTKWVGVPKQVLPFGVLSCRTLVVLKLTNTIVKYVLSVDLPSLKILHLNHVSFTEHEHLAVLLSMCPILEYLVLRSTHFRRYSTSSNLHFSILPKLVRAYVNPRDVPLYVLFNVFFLRLNKIYGLLQTNKFCYQDLNFTNLIRIELGYSYYTLDDLFEVIHVLDHCPKLQYLVIKLKTCLIDGYSGSGKELYFAKYVMQNARLLHDMTIHSITSDENGRHQMLKELSLSTRLSSSCKLIFDY